MIRDYEVSLWTLQDGFISILKPFNVEVKGQIQDVKLNIKDDGTEEFSFSIPMYLYQKEGTVSVWQPNPLWSNVTAGVFLAGMRKIKVIFDKHGANERVFELEIQKVTERHESDELKCEVSCEGLAFHELGKIGYKESLTQEEFELDYKAWAENPDSGPEPVATLNYWNDKIFNKRTDWTYEINMRHSLDEWLQHDSDKVYEDAYVSSWELDERKDKLKPTAFEYSREKARVTLDLHESNLYNITQKLAETFGVFCRYEYTHDSNYHITGKKVIYYDNFIEEEHGIIDLTYPYTTNEVTREMDSTDIITKMYVQAVDDDTTVSGKIDILDVPANKMGEDYILNFDYMKTVDGITKEQEDEIAIYETTMHKLNNQIKSLQQQKINCETQLPDLTAQKAVLEEGLRLDQEEYNRADDFVTALTNGTGIKDRLGANCDKAVVREEVDGTSSNYYVALKEKGVLNNSTLKLYSKQTYGTGGVFDAADQITNFQLRFDELGFVTQVYNLSNVQLGNFIYIEYQYSPANYYDKIKELYAGKIADDNDKLESITDKITQLEELKQSIEESLEILVNKQQQTRIRFETLMGPALREGYWQPEDYSDYGNKYNDSFVLSAQSERIEGTSKHLDFIWDNDIQLEEQSNKYKIGLEQREEYYLCIDCSSSDIQAYLKANLDKTPVISFFDFSEELNPYSTDARRTSYSIGSECQFGFLKDSQNNIKPVLIVVGAQSLPTDSITKLKTDGELGYFEVTNSIDSQTQIETVNISFQSSNINLEWIENLSNYEIVYPRLQVNSTKLKSDSSELFVYYNDVLLKEFDDYYSFIKQNPFNTNESENMSADWNYFITIKPEIFFREGIWPTLKIYYALSNADIAIYLDAIQVLKENSQPKVSYTIKVNAVDQNLIETAYNLLGRITNINDTDLKFKDVQGYISELNLVLDDPSQDELVIKNYKTKFEDVFSTIVAQTEAMQKNSYVYGAISDTFNAASNTFSGEVFQQSIARANLDLAFNRGNLTIDNQNGIWGTSDSGVVAFTGGGIFTATEKDSAGNWKWNTGILPSGINASLITVGQLDTNKIRIFSGDQIRFQWNGDGLFAYKSYDEDIEKVIDEEDPTSLDIINNQIQTTTSNIDLKQYVKLDENGLALIVEDGAYILGEDNKYHQMNFSNENFDLIKRVEISWEGFKIRNFDNEPVFYADTDGNLTLVGTINAGNGNIGGWHIAPNQLSSGANTTYVALNADSTNDYAIWAGATNASTTTTENNVSTTTYAPFCVTKTGQLRATGAIISGNITAETLLIRDGNELSEATQYINAKITPEKIWLGVKSYTNGEETSIALEDTGMEVKSNGSIDINGGSINVRSTGLLTVDTSNVIINTNAENGESIFQLSNGSESNPINYLDIKKIGENTILAELAGWKIASGLLYSGASTNYVGLCSSNDVANYAIWAGDNVAVDAPFAVTRDGKVYLNSLMVLDTWNEDTGKWEITQTTTRNDGKHDDNGFTPINFSRLNFKTAMAITLVANGTTITAKGRLFNTWESNTVTSNASASITGVQVGVGANAPGYGSTTITVDCGTAGSLVFNNVSVNASAIYQNGVNGVISSVNSSFNSNAYSSGSATFVEFRSVSQQGYSNFPVDTVTHTISAGVEAEIDGTNVKSTGKALVGGTEVANSETATTDCTSIYNDGWNDCRNAMINSGRTLKYYTGDETSIVDNEGYNMLVLFPYSRHSTTVYSVPNERQ